MSKIYYFNTIVLTLVLTGCQGDSSPMNGLAAGDSTPPTVVFAIPMGMYVPSNAAIIAVFSEEISAETLNKDTFQVSNGNTNTEGTFAVFGTEVHFQPWTTLTLRSSYTVTITTGVEDLAGNAMQSNYVWSFSTMTPDEPDPPVILAVQPQINEENVALDTNIVILFSKCIDANTLNEGTFFLRDGNAAVDGAFDTSCNKAIFQPSSRLTANTTYTGTITRGVRDPAGNAMTSDFVWSFTTGDGAP